jgi:hypothetical protein
MDARITEQLHAYVASINDGVATEEIDTHNLYSTPTSLGALLTLLPNIKELSFTLFHYGVTVGDPVYFHFHTGGNPASSSEEVLNSELHDLYSMFPSIRVVKQVEVSSGNIQLLNLPFEKLETVKIRVLSGPYDPPETRSFLDPPHRRYPRLKKLIIYTNAAMLSPFEECRYVPRLIEGLGCSNVCVFEFVMQNCDTTWLAQTPVHNQDSFNILVGSLTSLQSTLKHLRIDWDWDPEFFATFRIGAWGTYRRSQPCATSFT